MKDHWDILTGHAERDRRNVSILMESVAELYGPAAFDEATRRAVDRAIRVTGAERAILLVRDGDALVPRVARGAKGVDLPLDLRFSRSVAAKVSSTGQAHLTIDAENQSAARLGGSILDLRLLSIMATPLIAKGDALGILYVDSTVHAKEFTKEDFQVFQALGGLIALAIENARLLAERTERERLQRELDVARDIQQRLLPKEIVVPPGFDLAGHGRPCEETSGDYYDVIPLAEGRLALVIGDVSGHGLGPALYMAATRALVHGQLASGIAPVDVIRTLNAFLCRDMPSNAFMSLFLGVLDPAARTLTFVNAGHNAPCLLRADGSAVDLARTGPVLAVLEEARYRVSDELPLDSGDALVLFTDGIFEAHGEGGEIWSEERFLASFRRHVAAGRASSGVIDGVLGDLAAFVGDRPLEDDVTCLVLKVLGATS